jgi:hypothetical protein
MEFFNVSNCLLTTKLAKSVSFKNVLNFNSYLLLIIFKLKTFFVKNLKVLQMII